MDRYANHPIKVFFAYILKIFSRQNFIHANQVLIKNLNFNLIDKHKEPFSPTNLYKKLEKILL